MWTLLRLSLLCSALYFISGMEPAATEDAFLKPEPVNRQQYLTNAIEATKDLVALDGYSCGAMLQSFQRLADTLGCELVWEEKLVKDEEGYTILGQTNGDTIWMHIAPCTYQSMEVFFHEVGHVQLHFDGLTRTKDTEEREAEVFGEQLAAWFRDIDLYN